RPDDVWAQIHVENAAACEALLADRQVEIRMLDEPETTGLVGSVDAGSSDAALAFIATQPLEIGQVVAVPRASSNRSEVLYQLVSAVADHTEVKGGGHLFERARAQRIGVYHPVEHRFRRPLWTPTPGAPVLANV